METKRFLILIFFPVFPLKIHTFKNLFYKLEVKQKPLSIIKWDHLRDFGISRSSTRSFPQFHIIQHNHGWQKFNLTVTSYDLTIFTNRFCINLRKFHFNLPILLRDLGKHGLKVTQVTQTSKFMNKDRQRITSTMDDCSPILEKLLIINKLGL